MQDTGSKGISLLLLMFASVIPCHSGLPVLIMLKMSILIVGLK